MTEPSYKIGFPSRGRVITNLAKWLGKTGNNPLVERSYNVCKARNRIAERFLEECDEDWLIYMDDDNFPLKGEQTFEFLQQMDSDTVYIIPTVASIRKWTYIPEGDDDLQELEAYNPYEIDTYSTTPVQLFTGCGICIHRDTLKELPKPIWEDSPHYHHHEDVAFSYFIIHEMGLDAELINGSALHHVKEGMDLLQLLFDDYQEYAKQKEYEYRTMKKDLDKMDM